MAQAPASYIKQMKEFHGVFRLLEAELLGLGVLLKSARAEEPCLLTSPHPPLRKRASKFFLPSSSWVQESRLDTQWLAVAYEVLIPSSGRTGRK